MDLHESIQGKFAAIFDKILDHGPNLGMPFTKPMGKGLFEIRAKGHEVLLEVCFVQSLTIPLSYCIFLLKRQMQLLKKFGASNQTNERGEKS